MYRNIASLNKVVDKNVVIDIIIVIVHVVHVD
jgi:hypothetical protein